MEGECNVVSCPRRQRVWSSDLIDATNCAATGGWHKGTVRLTARRGKGPRYLVQEKGEEWRHVGPRSVILFPFF